MEFRILGPMSVVANGTPVPLGPPKRRLVLARLLCSPGQVVSRHRLIETLWGTNPPASAVNNLYLHVHHLRGILGAESIAGRGRPGYLLAVDADQIDAHRFATAAAAGAAALAAGHPGQARQLLAGALQLWRGEPFADLAADAALLDEAGRLGELRLTALEQRIDADLASARHASLPAELATLTDEHPFRERFHAQLMLALYRGGRRSEALAVYRAARRLLAGELGLEPGPELRGLEQAILTADPALDLPAGAASGPAASRSGNGATPTPADASDGSQPATTIPVPRELPADVAWFTGRGQAIARLTELLPPGPHEPPGSVVVCVVNGPAGVGKTALAVHWAHRCADRFPDGQLYLDLRGNESGRALAPIAALSALLRSLGTPRSLVPTDTAEAAARYRSMLAGRRMLIVLDGAQSADQVRDLLPGSPGCMVLITSRDRMTKLLALHGAHRLSLGVLDPPEAVRLLQRVLNGDQITAKPRAVERLAAACGYLPLALRVIAAELLDRPASPARSLGASARGS